MFDDRMAALQTEYEAVEMELADAATLSDQDRLRDLSRRHKELGEIVRAWHELTAAREDVTTGREMLTETSGDERELMRQEVDESEALVATLEERIQTLLLPKDPNEGRNVIMEIRGAVGGDEATCSPACSTTCTCVTRPRRSGRSRSSRRTRPTRTASTRPSSS